jgi:hypothetical protein
MTQVHKVKKAQCVESEYQRIIMIDNKIYDNKIKGLTFPSAFKGFF